MSGQSIGGSLLTGTYIHNVCTRTACGQSSSSHSGWFEKKGVLPGQETKIGQTQQLFLVGADSKVIELFLDDSISYHSLTWMPRCDSAF
jgi:hypothetical protein